MLNVRSASSSARTYREFFVLVYILTIVLIFVSLLRNLIKMRKKMVLKIVENS